jgi:hypothetical protein
MIPSGVIPAAQLIASVLTSLKTARDIAKDTTDPLLKSQVAEAYEGLLDLKERLLALDEENRQLKNELAKKTQIEGPIPPFGYFYKAGDREHPLCPKCYQSKEPREYYLTPAHPWNGGIRRECQICDQLIYEKEMNLSPRPMRIGRA